MDDARFDIGHCVRPMPGTVRGGDFVVAVQSASRLVIGIVDIAGHGWRAFETGRPVVQRLEGLAGEVHATPASLLIAAHELLRGSEGAAVGMAVLDARGGHFAGIGNVCCLHVRFDNLRRATCQTLPSRDGMAGLYFSTPRVHAFELLEGDLLLLHSDGVEQRLWRQGMTGMHSGSARTVAQAVVERCGRDSDDASCVVARRCHTGSRETR